MTDEPSPCQVCGARVRLKRSPVATLAEPDGYVEYRVCTNRECETNSPHKTLATPAP